MLLPFLFAKFATVGLALSDCGPSPISVPITDVILSNGHSRRGILGAVGTPLQNISFMPNTYLNDTWVYNATSPFCSNETTAIQCTTLRGGTYDTQNSTTFTHQSNVSTADGDPSDVARALGTHIWYNAWSTDTFTLGGASLTKYPIGMPGYDFGQATDTQANIGLGHNSTLLQRLKSEGYIASRSWSYWWGLGNSESASNMDGQLVLGGYDAAKVKGVPLTQPLQNSSAHCQSGMIMSITNMLLNFPNGTSADLNPSSVITGCISPGFPVVMTIPAQPYFWAFENITETMFVNRSLGTYFYEYVYSPYDVYPGNLQVQIEGGPVITFPNDVLIVPDQYTDSSGIVQSNDSAPVLLLSPLDGPNANDIPLIGLQFFAGAYISVNLDNHTWSIWPANPTTETNLITISNGECQQSEASSSSSKPSAAAIPRSKSAGLKPGAIAAIAVACSIALLASTGPAMYLVWKQSKAKRKAAPKGVKPSAPKSHFSVDESEWHYELGRMMAKQELQEMDSSEFHLTELHSKGVVPVELPGML